MPLPCREIRDCHGRHHYFKFYTNAEFGSSVTIAALMFLQCDLMMFVRRAIVLSWVQVPLVPVHLFNKPVPGRVGCVLLFYCEYLHSWWKSSQCLFLWVSSDFGGQNKGSYSGFQIVGRARALLRVIEVWLGKEFWIFSFKCGGTDDSWAGPSYFIVAGLVFTVPWRISHSAVSLECSPAVMLLQVLSEPLLESEFGSDWDARLAKKRTLHSIIRCCFWGGYVGYVQFCTFIQTLWAVSTMCLRPRSTKLRLKWWSLPYRPDVGRIQTL